MSGVRPLHLTSLIIPSTHSIYQTQKHSLSSIHELTNMFFVKVCLTLLTVLTKIPVDTFDSGLILQWKKWLKTFLYRLCKLHMSRKTLLTKGETDLFLLKMLESDHHWNLKVTHCGVGDAGRNHVRIQHHVAFSALEKNVYYYFILLHFFCNTKKMTFTWKRFSLP